MIETAVRPACHKLLHDMFQLKKGETLAITCDSETDMTVVTATAEMAKEMGAFPLILKNKAPDASGKAGERQMPVEALVKAIRASDAWIEYNNKWLYCSSVYDRIVEEEQPRPRYMNLCGATGEVLARNLGGMDLALMKRFVDAMTDYCQRGKHFLITSPSGTYLECDNAPDRLYFSANGAVARGGMTMFPGQISWSPDYASMNGTIVLDGSVYPLPGVLENPIRLTVERGYVVAAEGEGSEAAKYAEWLNSYSDPNMHLVGHVSMGFGPRAVLSGNVIEDERVWGCTEWGFGNVVPNLVSDIPGGIPAETHADGICLKCSVWIDGIRILDNGTVVGPTAEIAAWAEQLRQSCAAEAD